MLSLLNKGFYIGKLLYRNTDFKEKRVEFVAKNYNNLADIVLFVVSWNT